jgi:hypothetical protein
LSKIHPNFTCALEGLSYQYATVYGANSKKIAQVRLRGLEGTSKKELPNPKFIQTAMSIAGSLIGVAMVALITSGLARP